MMEIGKFIRLPKEYMGELVENINEGMGMELFQRDDAITDSDILLYKNPEDDSRFYVRMTYELNLCDSDMAKMAMKFGDGFNELDLYEEGLKVAKEIRRKLDELD